MHNETCFCMECEFNRELDAMGAPSIETIAQWILTEKAE